MEPGRPILLSAITLTLRYEENSEQPQKIYGSVTILSWLLLQ